MEIEIYDYEEINELFSEDYKKEIKEAIEKVCEIHNLSGFQKWLKEQPYSDKLEANFFVMDFWIDRITNGQIYLNVTKDRIEIKLMTWTEGGIGYHEETIGVVKF